MWVKTDLAKQATVVRHIGGAVLKHSTELRELVVRQTFFIPVLRLLEELACAPIDFGRPKRKWKPIKNWAKELFDAVSRFVKH